VTSQLCNRSNGNRFWAEITHCGGFTTSAQKKVDSQGKSSFVQNFDAYLETKGDCRASCSPHSRSFTACFVFVKRYSVSQQKSRRRRRPKNRYLPSATSLLQRVFLNSPEG
jgi:hypothetical protein